MRVRHQWIGLGFILAGASLLIYRTGAQLALKQPGPDFASFEDAAEVRQWKPVAGTEVSASTDFPSWQTHSLRVRLAAGKPGGVATSYVPRDWHRYEALQFFVYATAPASLDVELVTKATTVTQTVKLKQGVNHVQLKLAGFSGADLTQVHQLRLTARPAQPLELFLDRFRLTEYNEVLAELGRMDAPYGMEIQTPHVRWARPLVAGPVRMLIVPDVEHGRAAIEIAQRLECELFPVTLGSDSGKNRWGFGDFYGERGPSYGAPFTLAYTYLLDALLNGPRYDVMVLPGSRPWDEMPERLRRVIVQRVKEGMGLVLIDPRLSPGAGLAGLEEVAALVPVAAPQAGGKWRVVKPHPITRNVPLDSFPFDQLSVAATKPQGEVLVETETGVPVLAVRTLGRGRVVTAAWRQRGLIPLVSNQWATGVSWRYWEYMYSFLARAIVWAAQKEPSVGIEAIRLDRFVDPRRATIELDRPAPPGTRVSLALRDEHWVPLESRAQLVPEGARSVDVDLPEGPHGERGFVDVILARGDEKVFDWGSAMYARTVPVRIDSISFSSDRFKLGEPVTGTVFLSGQLVPGLRLELRLYDNYGRLLSTAARVATSATEPFSLSSRGCLTRLARVEAELKKGQQAWHKRSAEVFILLPRRWDHYDVVMYQFGTEPAPGLWDTIQQRLKEMYVTTLSSYPLELSKHANFGVQAQTRISGQESPDGPAREPYMEQKRKYAQTGDKKYLHRLVCLNDPAYRKRQEEEIARKVTPWVPFSPMSYYIYEEPSLTCYEDAFDLCFSPHCMRKFRDWLQKEYGSLEALNRQWGTRFERWEDVMPDTAEEAQARGNYSSWADHRTFMEITYAENYAYVRELLRRHDPDGLVLLSGTQASTPHNGCDYSRLDFIVDHLNPYNHEGQLEFHRSFNPQIRLSGGSGYGVHGRRVLYSFYQNLFHGQWAGSYIFWQYSILNPDYRFCRSARDIQEGYRELVGGGVAQLIRHARRENFGIGIHYSYPSIHAAWIVDGHMVPDRVTANWGRTGNKFRASRDGWTAVLEDLGLQYDFVPRQWIEAGELKARGFRVLILPFSLAISDAEAAALRAFVRDGGVLIADGQAGVMDGHAGWRPGGVLDDVFGIQRPAPVSKDQLPSTDPDPFLELKGARAMDTMGKAPVLLVHRYGQGLGIYLNFFLTRYREDRLEGRADLWRQKIARALGEAGIRSPYKVLGKQGQPLQNFELVPYQAGAARYLGLLKEDHWQVEQEPLRVELDQAWHVYDVRRKRYLGRTQVIQDEIRTAEPKLYALLPGPIGDLAVRFVQPPQPGRDAVLDIRLQLPAGVESALRVEVFRPSGQLAWEYTTNVFTQQGRASVSFPLAWNDPAGPWRVVVTDAIAGKQAIVPFQLRAATL